LATRRRLRRDNRQDRSDARWQVNSGRGGLRGLIGNATGGQRPISAVKRLFKMDTIYLLLVREPSQEEIQQVMMERAAAATQEN
jgi:hypothetical protein